MLLFVFIKKAFIKNCHFFTAERWTSCETKREMNLWKPPADLLMSNCYLPTFVISLLRKWFFFCVYVYSYVLTFLHNLGQTFVLQLFENKIFLFLKKENNNNSSLNLKLKIVYVKRHTSIKKHFFNPTPQSLRWKALNL